MLRFLDSGESHGKCLTAIIEGFPANVSINEENINKQLKRRQAGYGRGQRMKIENDKIEVLSGIRGGRTIGSPICIAIYNKDFENWMHIMDSKEIDAEKIIVPRPGHADLNGALKYNFDDIRNVIERASARETAIRVAIGAISMELLKIFNVKIVSRVIRIGNIEDNSIVDLENTDVVEKIENSPVRCYDSISERKMMEAIDCARNNGDTLGGAVEVLAFKVPCGLGSYVSYDRRIDYYISGALMSIQGVKAVEFGEGIHASYSTGSMVNDEIVFEKGYYSRRTNYSGGIEGGITSGMPIAARVYMKPIPTIRREIKTADLKGRNVISRYERSDTCAVPTLGVISENVLAYEIVRAFLEKFPGDSIEDIKNSYDFYTERIARG